MLQIRIEQRVDLGEYVQAKRVEKRVVRGLESSCSMKGRCCMYTRYASDAIAALIRRQVTPQWGAE